MALEATYHCTANTKMCKKSRLHTGSKTKWSSRRQTARKEVHPTRQTATVHSVTLALTVKNFFPNDISFQIKFSELQTERLKPSSLNGAAQEESSKLGAGAGGSFDDCRNITTKPAGALTCRERTSSASRCVCSTVRGAPPPPLLLLPPV